MNILNPTTWLIGALALALFGGAVYVVGRSDGRAIEKALSLAKENKAVTDTQAALALAQEEKTVIERNTRTAMVAASTTYQKGLQDERNAKDKAISAVRAGDLRLRDPGAAHTIGKDALPGVGATASRCDGEAGGKLSDALT